MSNVWHWSELLTPMHHDNMTKRVIFSVRYIVHKRLSVKKTLDQLRTLVKFLNTEYEVVTPY